MCMNAFTMNNTYYWLRGYNNLRQDLYQWVDQLWLIFSHLWNAITDSIFEFRYRVSCKYIHFIDYMPSLKQLGVYKIEFSVYAFSENDSRYRRLCLNLTQPFLTVWHWSISELISPGRPVSWRCKVNCGKALCNLTRTKSSATWFRVNWMETLCDLV